MTSDTCVYPDMSVVIVYVGEKDAHHDSVVKLLNGISDRRVSPILELQLRSTSTRALASSSVRVAPSASPRLDRSSRSSVT